MPYKCPLAQKAARRRAYLRHQFKYPWRDANPDRYRAIAAEQAARRRTRVPPWVTRADTRPFYEMAARVSRCLGLPFEVDHIVPLQGETVSGLHVPLNLRVIPRIVNRRKSASYLENCSE